jgi:hypothetical protein
MVKTGETYEITDSPMIAFMDVGCWQGGVNGKAMTTFGLVSEHDIVLCSWLKNHKDEQSGKLIWQCEYLRKYSGSNDDFIPSPLVEKFLESSGRIGQWPEEYGFGSYPNNNPEYAYLAQGMGRGFIQKWVRFSTPLTDDHTLLVIIGDLHLHLYKGTKVDRFQYRLDEEHTLVSLDRELRMLLDHAKSISKSSNCNVQTIQTGDMYEVWESEILLSCQYKLTLEVREKNQELLETDRNYRNVRKTIDMLIETGKVHIHMPFMDHRGSLYNDSQMEENIFPKGIDDIEKDSVNFRNTDDICQAIRNGHSNLFNGHNKIFDLEIRGNHDNFKKNSYWPKYSPESYRSNPKDEKNFLKQDTKPATGDHIFHIRCGNEDSIWLEHGHYFDWHNNNIDWWIPEHGFHIVHTALLGLDAGFSLKALAMDTVDFHIDVLRSVGFDINQGLKKIRGGELAIQAADLWTDHCNYEMRLPELRRADKLCYEVYERENEKMLKLIIMGHTHNAYLTLTNFFSLYEEKRKDDEYLNYLKSPYYWIEKKEIE